MALPKTFTGGERLFAGDLNDNFQNLDTRVSSAESELTTVVQSPSVSNIIVLTQAAYDGLTPDANTVYLITD